MTDDLEVVNRFEDSDDDVVSNSPIAKYAPQLEDEPDPSYRVFLMFLSIPPEYRSFDYMANHSNYSAKTLKLYSTKYKWKPRAEEYDRNFLAEKSAHAVKADNKIYQNDIIYQSLDDFRRLRDLWSDAVEEMQSNRNFTPMDIQRMVTARGQLDNMARRAVGLPTSISQSHTVEGESLEEGIEGYYLDTDGSLKEIRKNPGGD